MNRPAATVARLLAYEEALPAESRDLTDLIKESGTLEQMFEGPPGDQDRQDALWSYLREAVTSERLNYWMKRLALAERVRPSASVVVVGDTGFPPILQDVFDCPPYLFVDGSYRVEHRRSLAVVGSRSASQRLLDVAWNVATACAEAGVTVVSGLADGIDSWAHLGALQADGQTIAVVAGGIDRLDHRDGIEHGLRREIAKTSCVVSQFAPGMPLTPSALVSRNALISGLATASLIVTASAEGGTRTEAQAALRQKRPVFLWGPALSQEGWAARMACEPGAEFVADVEAVVSRVSGRAS